jgi:hypothetical protein
VVRPAQFVERERVDCLFSKSRIMARENVQTGFGDCPAALDHEIIQTVLTPSEDVDADDILIAFVGARAQQSE